MSRLYDQMNRVFKDTINMPVISADNVAEYIYGKYGVYTEEWKAAPCLAPLLNPVFIELRRPPNTPSYLPNVWGAEIWWVKDRQREAFYSFYNQRRTPDFMIDMMWDGIPGSDSGFKHAHWLMFAILHLSHNGRLFNHDVVFVYPLKENGALLRGGSFMPVPKAGGFCDVYQHEFFKRNGALDKSGELIEYKDQHGNKIPLELVKPGNFGQSDAMDDCMYPMLNGIMMALALMHCKNVELIDQPPPPALSKRAQKKHGQPLVTYKVLKVNPMRTLHRVLDGEAVEHQETPRPLHICRGHFKDFRDGKGLFGKFKEIYWWDQHLRGNEENGVVVKDYEVEEPEAS